jgi:integrase
LPYKGLDFLKSKITEACVKKWADALKPGAKTTLYNVQKYIDWVKGKGYFPSAQAMLDDQKKCRKSDDEDEEFKHLEMLKEYISAKRYVAGPHKGELVGTGERKAVDAAVRNFYASFHRDLPKLRSGEFESLFAASELDGRRAGELTPLTADDAHRLALALPQPWRAVVVVMIQGALAEAEFEQFNQSLWRNVVKNMSKPGPVMVEGLIRHKTAARQAAHKGKVKTYYTFLGKDAKDQIKEWLAMRPKTTLPHLFVVRQMDAAKRAAGGEWTPVVANTIQKNVTLWAKRSKLIEESDLNRYRVHPHEVRDMFKTLCSARGVSKVASEFFMGHDIDRLKYDKSPEVFPDDYRNEYKKVEPYLNILSNPSGPRASLDEARRAAREEFTRMRLAPYYSQTEMAGMNVSEMSVEEVDRRIAERKAANRATDGGQPNGGGGKQKVIPLKDLSKWVDDGWEFVQALPSIGQAVVRAAS